MDSAAPRSHPGSHRPTARGASSLSSCVHPEWRRFTVHNSGTTPLSQCYMYVQTKRGSPGCISSVGKIVDKQIFFWYRTREKTLHDGNDMKTADSRAFTRTTMASVAFLCAQSESLFFFFSVSDSKSYAFRVVCTMLKIPQSYLPAAQIIQAIFAQHLPLQTPTFLCS